MDEVQDLLGKPTYMEYQGTLWSYVNLSLRVGFDRGAAPTVTSVHAFGYSRKSKTLGNLYWRDIMPPSINFQTAGGISIGSSAFDVRRVYRGDSYQDNQGVSMNFESLGIFFGVTQDHIVYAIEVSRHN